jgi:hypothetical protein
MDGSEGFMAWWILECQSCGAEFTHSQIYEGGPSIRDPFTHTDIKPEFQNGGESLICPRCMGASVYQRYQLLYRASAKAAR